MGLQMSLFVAVEKVRRTLIWITAGEAGGSDGKVMLTALKGLNLLLFSPFRAGYAIALLTQHFVQGYSDLIPSGY